MKLKCIVIDDDIHAINGIKSYLNTLSNISLYKAYTDPLQALTDITGGANVDVIFMDVDMPMISGIELSKAIRHKTSKLIFTTSHSKYAYEAFEMNASAYLLKPYTFARFAETLNRLFPQSPSLPNISIQQEEDYFFVRNKNEKNSLIKVRYSDIVAVESLQNYVRIYTTNETIVTYIALSEIKIILQDYPNFAQAHRSFIIAKNHIEKVEGNTLKMVNNLTVNVGNSYREGIQEYIKEKTIRTSRS
ncbi:MAG: LytTR family DNA-binding domain-containing protein [Pedobacter agri]|uniref:LytTR family DNA-binding domain-containing protein n=1 Tax=Pedobacter agri TaxID=454586 RepID=A0A9X3I9F1_9SPHI|nr:MULTISPECIES: LytTR family DNA-binding domain-containing protein [Pedobacter]AZI27003.1 DNA-binding response regulator [Pedobacter sp. G11]MCX3265240.1 LytTR family DNA-binding domain-containing protein [Pedobacter agri]MDQ1138697.1 DNA-binding LytR/AlgR family response regulator [Pedobacter agri]RZJ80757.1 MAG: response regulator transcription factor [Flavobacterium sp.]